MTIAAYAYQADIYCPDCIREMFATPDDDDLSTENTLDRAARRAGINRYDEHSFDSDDFPKVVFANQVEDASRCGGCGEELS